MKKLVMFLLIALFTISASAADKAAFLKNVKWLGQATVRIAYEGKIIYIDPYKLKKGEKADFIFITHGHSDHLSLKDLEMVASEKSVVVVPESCKDKLKGVKFRKLITVNPGSVVDSDGLKVKAVHAYNVKKVKYHPKSNNWVGYVFNFGGVKFYHAGDTELIPEMKNIDCDIVMLPLGQVYTMNSVKDAVQAALDVKAEVAVPIHFGMYEGTAEDAQKFKKLLKGKIKVIIMDIQ